MRINASVIANNEGIILKECTDAGEKKVNLYLSSILAYLMCDVLCLVFMESRFDEIPQRAAVDFKDFPNNY